MNEGQYLGTPGAWINGTFSSHIHGELHHEFNKRTPPWMWEEGAPFSIFWEYLRITLLNIIIELLEETIISMIV